MPQRAKALLKRIRVKINAFSQRDTSDVQEILPRHGKKSDINRGSSQPADLHQNDPKPTNGTARRSKPESRTLEDGTACSDNPLTTNGLHKKRITTPQTIQGGDPLNRLPITANKSYRTLDAPFQIDDEGGDIFDQWNDYTEQSFGKTEKAPGLASVPGIDLANSVDVDHDVSYSSAVTQETVRPHVHEVVQEQIHRDIHTYDHYHYVQPVYDLEILPARHFVPNAEGQLVEVAEADLPGCTGANQKWSITDDGCIVDSHHAEEARLVPGKF